MQAIKTVALGDGKKITVKELTVRQVFNALKSGLGDFSKGELNIQFSQLLGGLEEIMILTTGMDKEQLAELYPSEIEQVLAAVKEVNKSFFALMEKSDLLPLLKQIWSSLKVGFLNRLTSLAVPDMGLLSGNSGGPGSSDASNPVDEENRKSLEISRLPSE